MAKKKPARRAPKPKAKARPAKKAPGPKKKASRPGPKARVKPGSAPRPTTRRSTSPPEVPATPPVTPDPAPAAPPAEALSPEEARRQALAVVEESTADVDQDAPAPGDPNGLSLRRRRFVEAICGVAVGNATMAASIAGYAGSAATLATTGSRLLRNAKVREAIAAIRAPEILRPVELQLLWTDIALGERLPDAEPKDRIKASELIAKAQGVFVTRHKHEGEVGLRPSADGPDLSRLNAEELGEYERLMAQVEGFWERHEAQLAAEAQEARAVTAEASREAVEAPAEGGEGR